MRFLIPVLALASTVHAALPSQATPNPPSGDLRSIVNKIQNVIVLYLENQSFDGLLPFYPGADGMQNLTLKDGSFQFPQKNKFGEIYNNSGTIPRQWMPFNLANGLNQTVARMLPNAPWDAISGTFPIDPAAAWGDITHHYYEEQYQINNAANTTGGCKLDQFIAFSDGGPLTMGYYDQTYDTFGKVARQGVLLDHFHHSVFGGSFLNHQFLIAAQALQYPTNQKINVTQTVPFMYDPPRTSKSVTVNATIWPNGNADGSSKTMIYPYIDPELLQRGFPTALANGLPIYESNPGPAATITPDDYAIYTIYPPVPLNMRPTGQTYAPYFIQNVTTIGDILTANNITWTWYAESFNLYLSDPTYAIPSSKHNTSNPLALHHQPFLFHQRFADLNSTDSKTHLKDEADFLAALKAGTGLPQVSFMKPNFGDDYHPGYSGGSVTGGEKLQEYINAIQSSPYWNNTAVIVTFDENGGRFDHVCPPVGDRWGPGLRIPSILLSPYVTPATIDHNTYETLSILRMLTTRFNLTQDILAMNSPARSSMVNDLSWAFAPSNQAGPFVNPTATPTPTPPTSNPNTTTPTPTSNPNTTTPTPTPTSNPNTTTPTPTPAAHPNNSIRTYSFSSFAIVVTAMIMHLFQ